eukprot:CAMPEP_0114671506 /NCGR_PEP_ID=MMETSP0191-20121206/41276_1 /TAXON_ID=126664 /ORGANISM="Sorites sp." /LENGTH=41 /DNA_ID= /DNA_START= /DNA_END= /DNA_ORIENTATION=
MDRQPLASDLGAAVVCNMFASGFGSAEADGRLPEEGQEKEE